MCALPCMHAGLVEWWFLSWCNVMFGQEFAGWEPKAQNRCTVHVHHQHAAYTVSMCIADLQECLEAQQQRPLLSELETLVGQDRQLVVSCAAVSQFEILLQQFSGPLERQRWAQLVPQLRVYHCTAGCRRSSTHSSSNASHQACAVCGDNLVQSAGLGEQQQAPGVKQLDRAWFPLSGRLQELEKMSLLQQAVFSLGDALHALTLTANGSAVRAAAVQGVVLDVQQHRPVWLTGL